MKTKLLEVPLPIKTKLKAEELFDSNNVPNVELLRRHLEGEGKLAMSAIRKLIDLAVDLFSQEENLLTINGTVKVVGGLHGHFYDLMTIMDNEQRESLNWTMLFLGSYIHDGEFGLEVVFYLFALKILLPKKVFLLRGNQDCRTIGELHFKNTCKWSYNLYVYDRIMESFDRLPIAAVVNDIAFCVHGGISPEMRFIHEIAQINRATEPPTHGLLTDLLWADVNMNTTEDLECPEFPFNSERGISVNFSIGALLRFLDRNNLRFLIRGNQPLTEGAYVHSMSIEQNTSRVPFISLCSAANLMNCRNKGGYLIMSPESICLRQFAWTPKPFVLPSGLNAFTWSIPFVFKYVLLILADMLDVCEGSRPLDSENNRRKVALKKMIVPKKIHQISREMAFLHIAEREKTRTQTIRAKSFFVWI